MAEINPQLALAQAVKSMRENMPAMMEHEELRAIIIRKKFITLVQSGFTETQALELCKQN
jgi:hypothetical protein